jgi:UDP-N-acetylglucosamine--N-acetylmuramyl-(pentapeptide) pyrophosphoryl-undecaprenol N-acetylglucosamine transferase
MPNKNMVTRILLVGGGTGGHVYPLIAVAEELKNTNASSGGEPPEIKFMGSGGLLKRAASEAGFETVLILSSKWRRYFSFQNLLDIFKFPVGVFQALYGVWRFMPDVIFAKGGHASFLPALAGKIFAVPIVIHESDSIPGKANVLLGKWARKVFLSFEFSKQFFNGTKCEVVGNPIRAGLIAGVDKKTALAAFGLNSDRPVILIIGGSQGSKTINDVLVLAIVEMAKKFQIIHQSGIKNFNDVSKQMLNVVKEGEALYGRDIEQGYRVYPALDSVQLALAYAAADVVVSRAGSQVFEIAAVGKPVVIVPLKNSAGNHQSVNAKEFAKFGASVIEESNLTPHILINEIEKAFENRAELSQKIKQLARPDAANKIAQHLLSPA